MSEGKRHSLADCQHEAVILAGCLEAISLMNSEGEHFENARHAVTSATLELANKLANDLDTLETQDRRNA